MRKLPAALTSLALLLRVGGARADTVDSYYRTTKLVEKAHTVDVTVHSGWADLVVRRSVFNGSEKADQAGFVISLPPGAVAVGLRTRGMLNGQPTWFPGKLLDADQASLQYLELTGIGPHSLRDPALLAWRALGEVELQVFPCAPNETKEVEYSLRMPTTYSEGKVHLNVPVLGTSDVPPVLTVHGDGKLSIDGHRLTGDETVSLDEAHEIEMVSAFTESVRGDLAVVPISESEALVSMHLDVAPRLSELPVNASIVVLIDTSRSVGDASAKAELEATTAYLDNFESTGARVAVVTFDRTPHDLTEGFVTLDRASKDVAKAKTVGANGSNLDAAIDHARALFDASKTNGPRRVLLLTDLKTKASLDPNRLAKLARMNAVLHVATVTPGTASVSRDDTDVWSALPRSTGGLLFDASIGSSATGESKSAKRAREREALLSWARPIALERVKLSASGALAADLPDVPVLGEGDGIDDLAMRKRAPQWIRLDAELWSTPVHKTLSPDEAHSRRWAGMLFGSDLMASLTPKEMTRVATWGGAVSPMTSFLAVEPGVRPSREGIARGNMWGSEIGDAFGAGGLGLSGIGEGGGGAAFDFEGMLRTSITDGVAACGAPGGKTSVEVETTGIEIVDVGAHVDGAPKLDACVEEAVWSTMLSDDFVEPHGHWKVKL